MKEESVNVGVNRLGLVLTFCPPISRLLPPATARSASSGSSYSIKAMPLKRLLLWRELALYIWTVILIYDSHLQLEDQTYVFDVAKFPECVVQLVLLALRIQVLDEDLVCLQVGCASKDVDRMRIENRIEREQRTHLNT